MSQISMPGRHRYLASIHRTHRHNRKRRHSCPRIVRVLLHKTRVNDEDHTIDRNGRLSNVRSQHDLQTPGKRDVSWLFEVGCAPSRRMENTKETEENRNGKGEKGKEKRKGEKERNNKRERVKKKIQMLQ